MKTKYLVVVLEMEPHEGEESELEELAEAIIELTEEQHPTGSTSWDIVEGETGGSVSVKLP